MIDTSLVAYAVAFIAFAAVATALALAAIAAVVLEGRRPALAAPVRRLPVAGTTARGAAA